MSYIASYLLIERAGREAESIPVDLRFHVSPQGWIEVDHELTPQKATGNFLDFGLAFNLPGAMHHLTWVGDDPDNSYPGQTDAAERGIWHIAPRGDCQMSFMTLNFSVDRLPAM